MFSMPAIIVYFIILIAVPMWAQSKVKKTYKKYSKVSNSTGISGAEVARRILDHNGLFDVSIQEVQGELSDHYDPRKKVVNLSTGIHNGHSLAGTAVAAHEVGHAIQDSQDYAPLRFRHSLVPAANLGSNMAWIFIIGGMLLQMTGAMLIGIIFFAAAVLFQLVTLPVEFNASSRAMDQVVDLGIIRNEEERKTRKVLNAAAMTYVAAAIVAMMELLRFVLMFVGMNDE